MFDFDGMSDEQIGQASSEEEEEYQASNRRKFTNSAKKESKPWSCKKSPGKSSAVSVETDGKSSVKLTIDKSAINLDKKESKVSKQLEAPKPKAKPFQELEESKSSTVKEEKRSAGKHFSKGVPTL